MAKKSRKDIIQRFPSFPPLKLDIFCLKFAIKRDIILWFFPPAIYVILKSLRSQILKTESIFKIEELISIYVNFH